MEEYIKYIKWLGMLIYKKELDLLKNQDVEFVFQDKPKYRKEKEDIVFIIYSNGIEETVYKLYKYLEELNKYFKIVDISVFKGNDKENFSDTILVSLYCVDIKRYNANLQKYDEVFSSNIEEVDCIYKKISKIVEQEKEKMIEINDIPQNDINIRINDLYKNMLDNLIQYKQLNLNELKNNAKEYWKKDTYDIQFDKKINELFLNSVNVDYIDKFLQLNDKRIINKYSIRQKKYKKNKCNIYEKMKNSKNNNIIILDYPEDTKLNNCIKILNDNKLKCHIIVVSNKNIKKNNNNKTFSNVYVVKNMKEVLELIEGFKVLYISNEENKLQSQNIISIKIENIEKVTKKVLTTKILEKDTNLLAFANLDHINSVKVLTGTFLNFDGTNYYSGGAERYLIDLYEVCKDIGMKLRIYQKANYNFFRYYGNIEIVGLTSHDEKYDYQYEQDMEILHQYGSIANNKTKLNIYSSFLECHGKSVKPSIGISHGVAWDNKLNKYDRNNMNDKAWIIDAAIACDKLISVDTNTANYFQTVDYKLGNTTEVVQNYVDINEFMPTYEKNNSNIVIIYPRRLYEPRGLYLLLDITDKLMEEYSNIEIHFVGKGFEEDTNKIQEKINKWGENRVKMYSCPPQNMNEVYKKADISVIPTLYSEGTSLSCLEAMSSENAVIATRIGGLTDLIINKYNGILIEPNSESLYNAIKDFINDPQLMKKCQKNAREVAKSFNKNIWIMKWKNIIKQNSLKMDIEENVSYNILKIYVKEEKINNIKLNRIILANLLKNNTVYIITDRIIKEKSYGRLQFISYDHELYRQADAVLVDKDYDRQILENKYKFINI